MAFNNEAIKALKPGETLWDKDERSSEQGLHVRSLASGKKPFMLYYRTKTGIQRRPKIGEWPRITIGEARKRASLINARVAIGEDPKGEWDTSRKEKTVGDVYALALESHWSQERYIHSRRKYDVETLWRNYLSSKFESLKITEVTAIKVRGWHQGLIETPYAANRAKEVLSKIFTFAEENGHCPLHTNPCGAVAAHPEKSRKRFASAVELKKILELMNRYAATSPFGVAYLYLLLFTGSRPKAIEDATWDQLQVVQKGGSTFGVLTLHGKSTEVTGEDDVIILPPQAMEVIGKLPRISGGTITNSSMPKRLWQKIRTEAGCPDLWARDFRRLFATTGLSIGVNLGTISELFNHSSQQTTKTYAKLMLDARLEAAGMIAKQLESLTQE